MGPAGLCQAAQVLAARGQPRRPLGPEPLSRHLMGQQRDGHPSVRPLTCHQLVQQDAVGVHVTGLAHPTSHEQLRGHVGRGALQNIHTPQLTPAPGGFTCHYFLVEQELHNSAVDTIEQ
jgi:hypothetical protein